MFSRVGVLGFLGVSGGLAGYYFLRYFDHDHKSVINGYTEGNIVTIFSTTTCP